MYHYIKPTNKSIIEIQQQIDKSITGICDSIWPRVKDMDLEATSFNGLCNCCAQNNIYALKKIDVFAYPIAIGITVNNPVYKDKTIGHYVSVLYVNNEIYIYDMPQHEFISPATKIKGGFMYKDDYQPRFIHLTEKDLMDNYKIDAKMAEKNYNRIIEYEVNQYPFTKYMLDTMLSY